MRKSIITILATFMMAVFCAFGAGCVVTPSTSSSSKGEETQTCVLSELAIDVNVDESFTLQVLGNDLNWDVEWTSSNANIATVENGTVVGVAPGSVNVTAKVGEQSLVCEVTVVFAYENAVYVTLENELEVDGAYELNLLKGSTYTLSPSLIDGEKVKDATFTLTSKNAAVTVNGLTLTAVSVVEKAEVVISCTYQETTYRVSVFVTVAE